jgi:hypothetical protein
MSWSARSWQVSRKKSEIPLVRSAGLAAAATLTSRVLGLARDQVLAAFVPTFTRVLTVEGKSDAWRLGNNVLNGLLAALTAFAKVLAIAEFGDAMMLLRERLGEWRRTSM